MFWAKTKQAPKARENIGVDTVTWDYTYDQMGRLETVYKYSLMAEAYSYDGQGDRLSENNTLRGVSRSYTYTNEDQIVFAGDDFYTYDVDGFFTTRTIGGQTDTFDYSSRGELLAVSLSNGDNISYDHDPMGRRISKSINGSLVEMYLWQDATTLLAVYGGYGNLKQRFEYADGRMPVSMTQEGQVYYLAYDQVGSLRIVSDSVGTVVKRVDYDSFGNILSDSDPGFTVPFGFAGGLHDRDTGLVRFGARDYDLTTGKWTAKDPIDFAGGGLNLLNYCLQDPVNWIDSTGLVPAILPEDMWDSKFVDLDGARRIGEDVLKNEAPATGLSGPLNGPQDAWRHTRWNQRMVEELGLLTAVVVGFGYELNGLLQGQPWEETLMDLHNNREGRIIANTGVSPSDLLNDGDLMTLNPPHHTYDYYGGSFDDTFPCP